MKKLLFTLIFAVILASLFSLGANAAAEHTVTYSDGERVLKTVYVSSGQSASEYIPPEKIGYDFITWYKDGAVYDFNTAVEGDMTLYAEYALKAPTYALNSQAFVYDGKEHTLDFDNLYHPLENVGFYNMEWYKGTEFVSSSLGGISLKNVSDSGEYYCKLTFTYLGESVTVTTNTVTVEIQKAEVAIPEISKKEYNGKLQYADILSSSRVSVVNNGGIEVGKYEVILTLTDNENYIFSNGSLDTVTLDFEIIKANNSWVENISAEDYFLYRPAIPNAVALYGQPTFLYSSAIDGEYTDTKPSEHGIYYVRAVVYESDNFLALESDPIQFTIYEELPSGISIQSMPNKTVYTAFETLDTDGLLLSLSYNSGRVEIISADICTLIYGNEDNLLLCEDTSILISYSDLFVSIPVKVNKADFDLSGVSWVYDDFTYDGTEKGVYLSGLPTALGVSYTDNNKIRAGKYTAIPVFSYDSANYNPPSFPSLEWEIAPREIILLADSITLNFGEIEDSLTYKVISGSIVEGDAVDAFLWHDGESVYISADNPNYSIACIKGRVNYIVPQSDSVEDTIIYICFAFIILVLLLLLAQKNKKAPAAVKADNYADASLSDKEGDKKEFSPTDYFNGQRVFIRKRYIKRSGAPNSTKTETAVIKRASQSVSEIKQDAEQSPKENTAAIAPAEIRAVTRLNEIIATAKGEMEKRENIKSILSVDVKKADSLISNALAKSLLHKTEEIIVTNGSKKAVVNIDTLNKNFASGERVDINALKAKRLVSKDAGYLKVLSRGQIDKPLIIYATDFSLSAVKMIALTGGEAIKCVHRQEKIQTAKYKECKCQE